MNKISIFLLTISFLAVLSCTKERLIIQENELEFDENSSEYQTYQAERAMEYIRMFRFEKLGDIFNKLNDPAVLKNLQDSLHKYRGIAETQALYVVTPGNDSLFFIPPENNSNPTLGDEVWLGTNFLANYTKMPNARGVVQGFKNYPKTTLFYFYNHLGTGIKGLEEMPDMKRFTWGVSPTDFARAYPDQEFEYVPLQADLSGSHKLEEILIFGIQLGNITYPQHKLKSFSNSNNGLGGGLKMPSGSLDGLWVEKMVVGGEADPDFTMAGTKTDNLTFYAAVRTFDVSKSEIKTLTATQAEKLILHTGMENLTANLVEKSTLPDGLKTLTLSARNLKENLTFPKSLKSLALNNYTFEPAFTDLDQMDTLKMSFSTNNDYIGSDYNTLKINTLKLPASLRHIALNNGGYYQFDMDGVQFPQSLQSIYISARIKAGTWDLSNLTNLKELQIYTTTIRDGDIDLKLPASIEKINFSSTTLAINTLDLSRTTNLNYMHLGTLGGDNTVTLILPPNLNEHALINASNYFGGYKPVNLKTGSTIINKPSWFDQYVTYY
ncbi:hypothetical protein H8B06_00900 [Sphingobacterium sp. DN00404]|uniref:Leucine-rich repeat domain-containing protein n=1 Tax=Sphingobacterium micropteri TaxID=2763501 RepID=A0ABR7YJK0_9SPHI|nr:hypothetical protein [Sphingobacterium micropteri]MBD1431368.1 hypothetical protein [Sphingobacterium micropteri]